MSVKGDSHQWTWTKDSRESSLHSVELHWILFILSLWTRSLGWPGTKFSRATVAFWMVFLGRSASSIIPNVTYLFAFTLILIYIFYPTTWEIKFIGKQELISIHQRRNWLETGCETVALEKRNRTQYLDWPPCGNALHVTTLTSMWGCFTCKHIFTQTVHRSVTHPI